MPTTGFQVLASAMTLKIPKILIIYLLFMGLYPLIKSFSEYRPRSIPVWAQWTYYELKDRHNHKGLAALHTAAVTGHKIKFPTRIKKILKSLHLEHLITPSGLHLSFITSLFFPFLSRRLRLATLLPIFSLSDFHSLKRMALLKILGTTKLSSWHCFVVTMTIDAAIGSLHHSPFSFLFGFLFLGSIIACSGLSIYIPFALLGAQVILGFTTSTPVYFGGYFLGLALTSLFGLLFPLLLLDTLLLRLPFWPLWSVSHYVLEFWWKLVLWASKVAIGIGPTPISFFGVLATIAIIYRRYYLAGLLIFLN